MHLYDQIPILPCKPAIPGSFYKSRENREMAVAGPVSADIMTLNLKLGPLGGSMQRTRLKLLFFIAPAFFAVAVPSGASQGKRASVDGDQLLLNVCVKEKRNGAPVLGLHKQDLSILIDNSPAQIDYFGAGDAPESIAFLVDRSGSMRTSPTWKAAVHELSRFPDFSTPGSEFLLLSFNETPKVVADWRSAGDVLGRAITSIEQDKPRGATALYEACLLGISKLAQAGNRKKFVLLITDGHDTGSTASYSRLHQSVQHYPVTFDIIGIKESAADRDSAHLARAVLDELTSDTGGTASFPDKPQQVVAAIESTALSMRQAYQIGLNRGSLPSDGKYHKVTVRVGPASGVKDAYVVSAPKGFLASN
jgi:VWFA-related protein